MSWITAAVAMGSNVGDREAHLRAALDALSRRPDCRVIAASSFHDTEPVGPIHQGHFLNAAVIIETSLAATALLLALHAIEASRGRDRSRELRWGPRTLDLDLLLFGSAMIETPGLTVPHPRMLERRFVLVPLAEIGADLEIPGADMTVVKALEALGAE